MTDKYIINTELATITCGYCRAYDAPLDTKGRRRINAHQINCEGKHPQAYNPMTAAELPSEDLSPTTDPATPSTREREVEATRTERIPFGVPRKRLNAPEDGAYHHRIFNDGWQREPGRILRAKQAGYEVVAGQESIAVGVNDDGSPVKGVLMRIPMRLYEEDEAAKQKEPDRVDEAIHAGTLEKQAGDRRYSPYGINIRATTGDK